MKKILSIALLLLTILIPINANAKPKYIFYFIGDGMGFNQVYLTQAALAARNGKIGFTPLTFTQFPIFGAATTHCSTRLTTDSAAAGTALSTGEKTSVGTIGKNTDHSENLETIAEIAHQEGLKVGILTTVSIDHATPAAFFAHENSRNMYTEIAAWIPRSEFDLLAGSGLLGKNSDSIYNSITKSGYTVVRGADATLPKGKTMWVQTADKNPENLPLAIDRKPSDMTLAAMLDKAIAKLDNGRDGFFIMAEGGQIDWASHANDAASIIYEVVDLDNAVKVALDFYKKHPEETLIIVTADHETGGLALGRNDCGYDTDFDALYDQVGSRAVVGDSVAKATMKRAGAAFTTGAHTAAPVPVYAIGLGAEQFRGTIDNTDIPRAIKEIIKED